MRLIAALPCVTLACNCTATQPSTTGEPSAAASLAPSALVPSAPARRGDVLFCAHGGQGPMAIGVRPDDVHRVVIVFEVDTPAGAPTAALALRSLAFEDPAGAVLARMRAPIDAERVERVPLTKEWVTALETRGPKFDGVLGPGITRIRFEAWLDGRPKALPARVRLVLAGGGEQIEMVGQVAGEWPTG